MTTLEATPAIIIISRRAEATEMALVRVVGLASREKTTNAHTLGEK